MRRERLMRLPCWPVCLEVQLSDTAVGDAPVMIGRVMICGNLATQSHALRPTHRCLPSSATELKLAPPTSPLASPAQDRLESDNSQKASTKSLATK